MKPTMALLVTLVCACDQGAKKPVEIKNGLRMTYSLAAGSPDAAATVMQKRLDAAKVTGIARAEAGQIVVDLAAADPEVISNAQGLLARTGRLDLKLVDDGTELMRKLAAAVTAEHVQLGITPHVDHWWSEGGKSHDDIYLAAIDGTEMVSIDEAKKRGCFRSPAVTDLTYVRCEVTGRQQLERFVVDWALLSNLTIPDDHAFVYERVTAATGERFVPPYWRSYYVKHASLLAPDAIAAAEPSLDPSSHRRSIKVTLTPDAAKAFGEMTRANAGKKMALIVDGKVASAPIIASAITGGRMMILMPADAREPEVTQIAHALASGPLPGPVRLETVAELKNGKLVPSPAE